MKSSLYPKILFILLCVMGAYCGIHAQTVIYLNSDSSWKGRSSSTGSGWLMPGYDDAAWLNVEAPNAGNVIPVVPGSVSMWALPSRDSAFMRKTFTIPVGDSYSGSMSINADNEFYMYFNGSFYGHQDNWFAGPFPYTVTPALQGCVQNVIALATINFGGPYGVSLASTFTVINPLNTPVALPAVNQNCYGFTARWDSVPTADHYLFDVSTDSTFATYLTGYDSINVGSDTFRVIGGLSLGTDYYYRLRAVRADLHSCYSDVMHVAPLASPVISRLELLCANDSIFLAGSWRHTAGVYNDSLHNIYGCDSIVSTTLRILSLSPLAQTVNICTGQTLDVGTHHYTRTGVYSDTLSNVIGCDSVVTTTLIVSNPSFDTIHASICPGENFVVGHHIYRVTGNYLDTLANVGGCDSFIWTYLIRYDLSIDTQRISLCTGSVLHVGTHTYNTAGRYVDILNNIHGCDSIITSYLTYNHSDTTNTLDSVCMGEIRFGQLWSHDSTLTSNYTNVQGCDSLLLHHVLVLPLPAADAGADQTIRYGDTALLHASGGLAFVWNNGINVADNPVHPISTTNYFVQVTDANNCSAFDSVLVTVQIPQTMLIMPDAFTPNADGLNDYLFPINTDNYSQVGLMVINRWGEVIYNENSSAKGWDGNYMGTPQPIGTYVYMINATEKLSGKQIQIQGSVSLIR